VHFKLQKYNELDYTNAVARVKAHGSDNNEQTMQFVDALKVPYVLDIERLKRDYHNAKVVIKAMLGNVKNYENYLYQGGNISLLNLKKAIFESNYKLVPNQLATACKNAINKYNLTQNSRDIDTILDEQYKKDADEIIDNIPDDLLKDILQIENKISLRDEDKSYKNELEKLFKSAKWKAFGLAPIYYHCKKASD
jgi:hypothetical protein